ncbi:glycosyltransferase family protein [Sphingomonas sp. Leaf4]|uniref:glycosyltransferase family protein n=1 Tax=Sphingomonas sp. Leaf4 TaxID=2876553 RepID=UPI001E612ABE|nr:hypothetical protein [Sphingomonas sp. Leaf4]
MRVMYWPNEPMRVALPWQVGGRHGFEQLLADGDINALEIFSYRREPPGGEDVTAFHDRCSDAVLRFQPDILFVQHVQDTQVGEALWMRLRRENPRMTIAYHEGDPFDRRIKRIDAATISAVRHADITFACGLGTLADILSEHSRTPIQFLPHCFDIARFAQRDVRLATKEHDIVMIGNKGHRRLAKFLFVPGGRKRAQLARQLSDTFGTRFALFGNGWVGLAGARGRLPFADQEKAIQSARITANWDHFDEIAYYFSDRLPIALAAGVPHVTSYHAGYEFLFRDCPGLYSVRTVREAVECCRWLTSRPDAELLDEGLAGRAWIFRHLEATVLFRRAFEAILPVHQARILAL